MHKDVAIKKVVQPTLVQTYLPTEDGKHEARSGEDSVSSAAAVAAVSAVIATQPFLKVGHGRTIMIKALLNDHGSWTYTIFNVLSTPIHILVQTMDVRSSINLVKC